MSDYEKTKESLRKRGIAFKEIPDGSGYPYFIVENKKPDRCPPGGAESYYAWGMYFGAGGAFLRSWGAVSDGQSN